MRVLLAEFIDQRARHLLGTAGFGHHLAEHRPQRDHQRNMPQRLAHPGLIRPHHTRRRHPRDQRKTNGNQGDDDERIEPVTGDQHDQRDDGNGGIHQQPIAEGRRHAVLLERVTFEWVVKLINHFEIEISNRMKVIFVERQDVSLMDMSCRD
ncbi:hypothetical protein D3C76_93210 [compost metagenome]